MTHKLSEQYRLELTEITKRLPKKVGECLPESLKEELLCIARKVGACTRSAHINDNGNRVVYNANIEDLISNIHQALNTASMIDACRTATRNFWIAVVASIVAVISVLINFLSMLATWIAALVK